MKKSLMQKNMNVYSKTTWSTIMPKPHIWRVSSASYIKKRSSCKNSTYVAPVCVKIYRQVNPKQTQFSRILWRENDGKKLMVHEFETLQLWTIGNARMLPRIVFCSNCSSSAGYNIASTLQRGPNPNFIFKHVTKPSSEVEPGTRKYLQIWGAFPDSI